MSRSSRIILLFMYCRSEKRKCIIMHLFMEIFSDVQEMYSQKISSSTDLSIRIFLPSGNIFVI